MPDRASLLDVVGVEDGSPLRRVDTALRPRGNDDSLTEDEMNDRLDEITGVFQESGVVEDHFFGPKNQGIITKISRAVIHINDLNASVSPDLQPLGVFQFANYVTGAWQLDELTYQLATDGAGGRIAQDLTELANAVPPEDRPSQAVFDWLQHHLTNAVIPDSVSENRVKSHARRLSVSTSLTELQSKVLLYRHGAGWSYQQIADELDMTQTEVRARDDAAQQSLIRAFTGMSALCSIETPDDARDVPTLE